MLVATDAAKTTPASIKSPAFDYVWPVLLQIFLPSTVATTQQTDGPFRLTLVILIIIIILLLSRYGPLDYDSYELDTATYPTKCSSSSMPET